MRRAQRVDAQDSLMPWGNPTPAQGECCNCKRGPLPLYRFNLIIEDAISRQSHTQLLCRPCTEQLLRLLIGQSVEATPQAELHTLDFVRGDAGWPAERVA